MIFTWLGHGSFRLEIGGEVLLIDPWLDENPSLPKVAHEAAVAGATQILVTHGHFDHTISVVPLSKATGLPVSGPYELVNHLKNLGANEGSAFQPGGTVRFGDVSASMVPASHSSSYKSDGVVSYTGSEVGYMIHGEGRTIYFSGDTGITADMDWMGDYYKPEIGVLSAGGHFTMDMKGAAYAAKRYFKFKTVIPGHYKTFPLLEQTADDLIAGLPGVDVKTPEVMESIEL